MLREMPLGEGAVEAGLREYAVAPKVRADMNPKSILFDIRGLQPAATYCFHGGGEHCEAILERAAHRLSPGQMVAYYDPRSGMPERTRELIDCRAIELIPIRSANELDLKLGGVSFGAHFRCVPPFREPMHRHNSEKTVCVAFGFRAIEIAADSMQWYHSRTPGRLGRFLLKCCLPGIYRQWRTAQWRRFLSQSTLDMLITGTCHSKYSLLAFAGDLVPADTVHTLYPPPPIAIQPEPFDFGRWSIAPRRYFLLVSANRWGKNAVRAVQAMDWIYTMQPSLDIKTVVLGCTHEGCFVVPVRNRNRFVFKPYVPHGQLQTLYANAFAFIYPTLNEGFGYPPLDAMRYGTPVLASAISSVPEVCADAASYFDPHSVHEMVARILHLISSPQRWTELSDRGRERFALMQDMQERDLETLVDMLLT